MVFWAILSSLFTVPLNRRTRMESIFWTAPALDRFSTRKPPRSAFKPWAESSPRKIHASCSTFPIENPYKRSELAFEKKSQKLPVFQRLKWMEFPSEDLEEAWIFRAFCYLVWKRSDAIFWWKIAPALVPFKKLIIDSTLVPPLRGTVNVVANSKSFKIAQNTPLRQKDDNLPKLR